MPVIADLALQVDNRENTATQEGHKGTLKHRVLSAIVMIVAAVVVTYQGGWLFSLLIGICATLMLYEWSMICFRQAGLPVFWLNAAFVWLIVVSTTVREPDQALMILGLGLPVSYVAARVVEKSAFWSPLGLLYVGLPAISVVWLRHHAIPGFEIILWLFGIVWATDIGGFVVGKNIRGPKLAPRISPNKTWSGLIGGILFAAGISALLDALFQFGPNGAILAVIAAAMAVWAQVGDIVESALKRHFGVKDSGALIPGHGGLLDRLDGLVFVAPVIAFGIWKSGEFLL